MMNRMKRFLLLGMVLTLGLISTKLSAQWFSSEKRVVGSKNLITKEVKVKEFEHLQVKGSCDVIFTPTSGKQKLEIYGSDNLIDLMEVEVKGDELVVAYKKGYSISLEKGAKLEVRIWAPIVKSATLNGSGDLAFKNSIETDHLELRLNGSGDLDTDKVKCSDLKLSLNGSGDIEIPHVVANTVIASVNGSGDIELKGQCTESRLSVNGSGDLDAVSLKADRVDASVSGSGDITCHAVERLSARVSGSGEVSYKGNPRIDRAPKRGLRQLSR